MNTLNRQSLNVPANLALKVVQFGGGNFLRAFTDWMIQILNEEANFEGGVAIVKPTERGDYTALREQEGLFQVLLNGYKEGELVEELRTISCVQEIVHPYRDWEAYLSLFEEAELRFVVSNTTEAGIRYKAGDALPEGSCPEEFPAKLCFGLWHRYKVFKGAEDKGCIILPLELISQNGAKLESAVIDYAKDWGLDEEFIQWVQAANHFCDTLVDRIVSGYPEGRAGDINGKNGREDQCLVAGEMYHSWIIVAPDFVAQELPFQKTDLNVKFVEDLDIYRQIKVRILNGAHTAMVPVGLLAGRELVSQAITDEVIQPFIQTLLFHEVIAQIEHDPQELHQFAEDVIARFKNPHIRHKLISIALNSSSKYKTRLLPSVLDYIRKEEKLPSHMLFALAALICLYKGNWEGKEFALQDNPEVLSFFKENWEKSEENYPYVVQNILRRSDIWDKDLTEIPHVGEAVAGFVELIVKEGMKGALEQLSLHLSSE